MDTSNTALTVYCLFKTTINLHKHASLHSCMQRVHWVLTLKMIAMRTKIF